MTLHGGEGRTTIQHYFVDEARLPVSVQMWTLQPGDALLSAPGTDHDLRNLTDEAVRVMVVWGEPGSADLTGFRTVQRAKALRAEQAG